MATKLGSDPTTIANPHARPRAGSARPVARPLPPVEERPDLYAGVRLTLQRGDDPPGLAVIGGSVWELTYRSVYPHGYFDEIARYRRIVARDRAEAIVTLQRLEFGCAERIILYDARTLKMKKFATEGTEDTENG